MSLLQSTRPVLQRLSSSAPHEAGNFPFRVIGKVTMKMNHVPARFLNNTKLIRSNELALEWPLREFYSRETSDKSETVGNRCFCGLT